MVLGLLTALGTAGTASASVTVSSFSMNPSTTLAGGHPDLTIGTNFHYSDASDAVQNLTVYFPGGLIGNPSVVSQCSSAQLSSDTCPAGSKIGTTSVTAIAAGIPLPVTSPGDVYNVTPNGSELARIGMVVRPLGGLLGKTSLSGPVSLMLPGNAGLISTFTDIPRTLPSLVPLAPPIPITITSLSLTLNGLVNGGTAAFMTNPTSCSTGYGVVTASSYESPAPSAGLALLTPTDCADVPFNPGLSFAFGATTASTPSALTVTPTFPAGDLPRAQSALFGNIVFLPLGTQVNFAALSSITACTEAQLAANTAAAPTCAASSQVGTVSFTTPVLGTLSGQVYFGAGTAANPLRLFIVINIKGQYAKLIANNSFYGPWIVSALVNLPQVPFTSFNLSFSGGPSALVQTPPCGNAPGIGVFIPYSGTAWQTLVPSVTISQTSTGAPCPAAASSAAATGLARDVASALRTAPRGANVNRVLAQVMARHHLRAHRLRLARHVRASHRGRHHARRK